MIQDGHGAEINTIIKYNNKIQVKKYIYIHYKMERVGTRAQVMHGNAKQTAGGLKKKDLKYNKQGKIVSKKMSQRAKKEKRLQKAGYTTKKGQFGAFKMRGGGGARVKIYFIAKRKALFLIKLARPHDIYVNLEILEQARKNGSDILQEYDKYMKGEIYSEELLKNLTKPEPVEKFVKDENIFETSILLNPYPENVLSNNVLEETFVLVEQNSNQNPQGNF